VELAEKDDLLEFSPVSATGPMLRIGRLFVETGLTEMRIEIPLEKAATAYAERRFFWFNALPASTADLSFGRRFEQCRTQAAKGWEKNDLERS